MTLYKARVVVALVFLSPEASFASSGEELVCKVEEVSLALGVGVVAGDFVNDSWGAVSYETNSPPEELIAYLDLLCHEFSKYPKGYLQQSQTMTIVIGRSLAFCDQPRAAIPDPYKKQLFLSVNGAYGISSNRYLAHVMHHELHHLTEYSMWKNMTYDWADWLLLNGDGFCYGQGGAEAYSEYLVKGTDFYTPNNPYRGFINLYSLTGDEEDRAELMAFLMTDFERPEVEKLLRKDQVLRKKTQLLAKLFIDFKRPSVQFLTAIPVN